MERGENNLKHVACFDVLRLVLPHTAAVRFRG
jgi:hypothetical protein